MGVVYKSPPKSILVDWTDKCLAAHDKFKCLSEWEWQFIRSIKNHLKKADHLSESQVSKLESMYMKVAA